MSSLWTNLFCCIFTTPHSPAQTTRPGFILYKGRVDDLSQDIDHREMENEFSPLDLRQSMALLPTVGTGPCFGQVYPGRLYTSHAPVEF